MERRKEIKWIIKKMTIITLMDKGTTRGEKREL